MMRVELLEICKYPITISTQYDQIACIELKSNIQIDPARAKIIADKTLKILLKNDCVNQMLLDKVHRINMTIPKLPDVVLTVFIKHYFDIEIISKYITMFNDKKIIMYIDVIYSFDAYIPGKNIGGILL